MVTQAHHRSQRESFFAPRSRERALRAVACSRSTAQCRQVLAPGRLPLLHSGQAARLDLKNATMIQPKGPSTAAQMMPTVIRPLYQPISAPPPILTTVNAVAHNHKVGSSSILRQASFMRITDSRSAVSRADSPAMLHSSAAIESAASESDR